MKLYLIHAGFYDKMVSGGFFESHTNYFVAADSKMEAKNKAKTIPEYTDKKMHIDGIMEVNQVDGYDVLLKRAKEEKDDGQVTFGYDEVKKIDS